MVTIKESTSRHPGAIEQKLFREDGLGRKGIDTLKEAGITFTRGIEPADIGISKHGDFVCGVPEKKCILLIGEPPIYYGLWNKQLNKKEYKNQFLAVMNTCKVDPDDYHFVIPQAFQTSTNYFNEEKDKFLCTVLRNKKRNVWFNNLFLSLLKYRKNSLLQLRHEYDAFFCKERYDYHSFGNGWCKKCFYGEVHNAYSTISHYKFNFCPENSSFEGYITEKPIQAIISGSIPVYTGPPDIDKYLPKETYVDITDFPYKEDLFSYLYYIDENTYRNYLFNMKKFIISDKSKPFSSVTFANKLIQIIEENHR